MEIRTLRYFLAVAREENMTRAAEILHVTQPTLSKQLRSLEEELGTKLFTRHSFSIQLTDKGREKMAEVAADHHPEWRELGVAVLHSLVIDTLLGLKGHDKPKYVHDVAEVEADLKGTDERFPLAALVMPATVQQIQELSMVRERMPAKSTYFYPKLITGFVFKPLE